MDGVFSPAGPGAVQQPLVRDAMSMADQSAFAEPGERTVVADYVAAISADLAGMARRTGLETLGYLLEMVRLEAESVTRLKNNGGR